MRRSDLVLALGLLSGCASAPPMCVRSAPALPASPSDVWACRLPGGGLVELVQASAPDATVQASGAASRLDCWLVAVPR